MSKKNISLPKTYFSGLDYENLMTDLQNLVRENPEYDDNWDDFLSSNAGVILTSVFSLIADQLASRIDMSVDELFLGTATKRESFIKLLNFIGYQFSLPKSSRVEVEATPLKEINGEIIFTPEYIPGNKSSFNPFTITAKDKKGNTRTYEALEYDDINNRFNYFSKVSISFSEFEEYKSKNVELHEGETKIADFIISSSSGETISLGDKPIARNSVRVFILEESAESTNENKILEEKSLLRVDNFLRSEAQRTDMPLPWVLNVKGDDSVEIEFGSSELLPPERRISVNSRIRVFYRVGGGIDGDLPRKSINTNKTFEFNGEKLEVNLVNKYPGIGGYNSETTEHAAYHAPRQIRTVGKTVTIEDYDTILQSNPNIIKSKSYGADNLPARYFEKYGVYLNPLEVLNYVLLNKSGWRDRHTREYYLSNWGTLNLENRFNGKYSFVDSELGQRVHFNKPEENSIKRYDGVEEDEIIINEQGDTIKPKNYFILETTNGFKEALVKEYDEDNIVVNDKFKGSITKNRFNIENVIKLENIKGNLFRTDDPYFYGKKDGKIIQSISENIHARVTSLIPLGKIPIIQNFNTFKLSFDGLGDETAEQILTINISEADEDGDNSISLRELVDLINSKVGFSYEDIKPHQDFGLILQEEEFVEGIENEDEKDYFFIIFDGTEEKKYTISTKKEQIYETLINTINQEISDDGFEATMIKNKIHIACNDIRITYVGDELGKGVELRHYFDPTKDLLENMGVFVEESSPVVSSDYYNVASVYEYNGLEYLMIKSPNKGPASKIELIRDEDFEDAAERVFGLIDIETKKYFSFGQKRATVIAEAKEEDEGNNFGNIIYENGSYSFLPEDPEYVYLNYIYNDRDTIHLGHYFNSFPPESPLYKDVDFAIYNTVYEHPEHDPEDESINFDLSNIYLRFTKKESFRENSLWNIESDVNIGPAKPGYIKSRILTDDILNNISDKTLRLSINNLSDIIFRFENISILNLGEGLTDMVNQDFFEAYVDEERRLVLKNHDLINGKIEILPTENSAHHILFDDFAEDEKIEVLVDGEFVFHHNRDIYNSRGSIDMILTNNRKRVPDTSFFIHYVSDRRHTFNKEELGKFKTDEDYLIEFLKPYKIAGVENSFKTPIFSSFDIKGVVYCFGNIPIPRIEEDVERRLREKYSLENIDISEGIIKAEIISEIMNSNGVRFVNIDFFGRDLQDYNTNEEFEITSDFDEIITISDQILENRRVIHGIDLTYRVVQ